MSSRSKTIWVAAISALATLALLFALYEPREDFYYGNADWSGYSRIRSELEALVLDLEVEKNRIVEGAGNYALLVVPEERPSRAYLEFLKRFVAGGGLLIVADDHGYGNEILEYLGVDARFRHDGLLVDPVFFWRIPLLPKAFDESGAAIALNCASVVECGASCRALANSSRLAFFDLDLDAMWDVGEPEGPLPVVVECPLGAGRVLLVSDPDAFANISLEEGEGLELLRSSVGERRLVLDSELLSYGPYAEIRNAVVRAASEAYEEPFLRIPAALAILITSLSLLLKRLGS